MHNKREPTEIFFFKNMYTYYQKWSQVQASRNQKQPQPTWQN